MSIVSTDTIYKFDTALTIVSAGGGTSAVAATVGTYSATADAQTFTNSLDVPLASFVLTFQFPSGTINQNGIQLLCRLLNTDGTGDEPVPSANWPAHALGSFSTGTGMSATTNYSIELGPVELPTIKSSQEYEFYLRNDCGVAITAGWTLKIMPMTFGPKP